MIKLKLNRVSLFLVSLFLLFACSVNTTADSTQEERSSSSKGSFNTDEDKSEEENSSSSTKSDPEEEFSSSDDVDVSSEEESSSSSIVDLGPGENFKSLFSEAEFKAFFPRKLSFYTYQGFVDAINEISSSKVKIEEREGITWDAPRVSSWTGSTWKVVYTHPDFNEGFRQSWTIKSKEIDFGKFLKEGSIDQRKEELMAFMAQMSHETTGRSPSDPFNGGLMFKEEVGYSDASVGGYATSNDPSFKAVAGQSYHGRGVFQISYPYNYGKFGFDIFGDNRGLVNPKFVLSNPKYAFMAAIWFWMRPQIPKPTMHDVILGQAADTKNVNGASSRFGWTTNIINGGLECGSSPSNTKGSLDRQNYFKHYMSLVNLTPEANLACTQMTAY